MMRARLNYFAISEKHTSIREIAAFSTCSAVYCIKLIGLKTVLWGAMRSLLKCCLSRRVLFHTDQPSSTILRQLQFNIVMAQSLKSAVYSM